MRTRQLAGATVTAIGSGDVSLGTSAARGVPARELAHAVEEAIAFGVTLIEAAPDRDSEQLVGEAVRSQRARDRVTVAVRVPVLAPRPGAPARDALPERLPAGHVQEAVEVALRASRLDALSLVQLPLRAGWRSSSAWPELAGTCARLVREGKVMAWGAWLGEEAQRAGAEPSELAAVLALIAEPWLSAVSVAYAVCDRGAEALFAAAQARALTVLARHPLAGGALAGRLGPGVKLRPRDDRGGLAPELLERIAVGVARLSMLVKVEPPVVRASEAARSVVETARKPAELECRDVAELALRFAIDRAGVALPRLHRRDELLAAIAAAAAPPLSRGVIEAIVGRPPEA